jgi:hypothetical protein
VAAGQTPSVAGEATSEDEPSKHSHTTDIKWYLPPIELHIVLAGLVFAVSLGALALTIRRLELPAAKLEPAEVIGPGDAAIATPPQSHEPLELVTPAEAAVISAPMSFSSHPSLIAPIIHAGRFWLLAFLAALVTALAGLSSVVDDFSAKRLTRNWESLQHPKGEYRLLLHVIFGASLILLPLILALLARYGRRRRGVTTVFLALIVLAIACQFWLGIALFYDGRHGFIYRFTP